MAFEKIETLVKAGRNGLPASATLSVGRGGGRPSLRLNLQKKFIEASFPVANGERFDLMIGSNDMAGLVRLQRNAKAGVLCARIGTKGSASFHCGHIARFGDEPAEREFCKAIVIDKNIVEISLPLWGQE